MEMKKFETILAMACASGSVGGVTVDPGAPGTSSPPGRGPATRHLVRDTPVTLPIS
jgi:hypothetical protein